MKFLYQFIIKNNLLDLLQNLLIIQLEHDLNKEQIVMITTVYDELYQKDQRYIKEFYTLSNVICKYYLNISINLLRNIYLMYYTIYKKIYLMFYSIRIIIKISII